MKNNGWKLFFGLLLALGLLAFSAQAELGLAGMSASEAGQAAKAAAEAAYANSDDPAEIQEQLTQILNEAEATGDEGIMTYAIIAVMMAGGADNLAVGQAAVDGSQIAANHPGLAATTSSEVGTLIGPATGSGEKSGEKQGDGDKGDGDKGDGDKGDGDKGDGGFSNPFAPGASGGNIDGDTAATPI